MLNDYGNILVAITVSFFIVILGVPVLRRILASKGVLDNPNARSSHSIPTPRGGGIAIVLAIIAGNTILWLGGDGIPHSIMTISAFACGLGLISWADDVWGVSAALRFICQIITVGCALYLDPGIATNALPFLPIWGAVLIVGAGWIWFINLYNFMDGIDGMTGTETVSICGGFILLSLTGTLTSDIVPPLAVIGVAAIGFLYWNWSPAKIFMGDVGSIPLGFLLGWFILNAFGDGAWLAALIIPGYFLADSTITLLKRACRGAPVWKAHREHFYQMPISFGVPHDRIMLRIIGANILLIVGAVWLTPIYSWLGIIIAIATISGVLWSLSRLRA